VAVRADERQIRNQGVQIPCDTPLGGIWIKEPVWGQLRSGLFHSFTLDLDYGALSRAMSREWSTI
jgi:hypothetical protein